MDETSRSLPRPRAASQSRRRERRAHARDPERRDAADAWRSHSCCHSRTTRRTTSASSRSRSSSSRRQRRPHRDAARHVEARIQDRRSAAVRRLHRRGRAATTPRGDSLRGIGSFEEGIIFLDVEPTPLSISSGGASSGTRGALRGPAEAVRGRSFHFHVTLAYGCRRRRSEKERDLRSTRVRASASGRRPFAMLCHTGDHWITYRRGDAPDMSARLLHRHANSSSALGGAVSRRVSDLENQR